MEWIDKNLIINRHALIVRGDEQGSKKFDIPPATASLQGVLKGVFDDVREEFRTNALLTAIGAMFTTFPITNISWWIAIVFTIGSIIWIMSSFFAFMPMDEQAPPSLSAFGCGITAFIGSLVFLLGAILLMLESLKDSRDTDFGWKVDQQWDEESGTTIYRVLPVNKDGESQQKRELKSWTPTIQLPTMEDMRTHYIYELAFWYSLIQLGSSLIFLISGITALPSVYDLLSEKMVIAVYWTPKLVACVGFITSALMGMAECQRTWLKPAWNNLGWHIGLWKLIGSIGFLMVPCFGFNTADWSQYVATVHCLWGKCLSPV